VEGVETLPLSLNGISVTGPTLKDTSFALSYTSKTDLQVSTFVHVCILSVTIRTDKKAR
jgi:hypothetical protein